MKDQQSREDTAAMTTANTTGGKVHEELELPAEAARTLARIEDAVTTMRQREEPTEECWAIGGGAVLAARWRHRGAELLTLHTTAKWPGEEDTEGRDGTLHAELAIVGYTTVPGFERLDVLENEKLRVRIIYNDTRTKQDSIDATVHGRTARTMTSTAVLESILQPRTRRRRGRSLLDVVAAAQHDPEALKAALNKITPEAYSNIETDWWLNRPRINKEASAVPGFDPEGSAPEIHDLVERASNAITLYGPK